MIWLNKLAEEIGQVTTIQSFFTVFGSGLLNAAGVLWRKSKAGSVAVALLGLSVVFMALIVGGNYLKPSQSADVEKGLWRIEEESGWTYDFVVERSGPVIFGSMPLKACPQDLPDLEKRCQQTPFVFEAEYSQSKGSLTVSRRPAPGKPFDAIYKFDFLNDDFGRGSVEGAAAVIYRKH